ncbi:MAG: hypothetical protein HY753_00050 [Nitrospirae bacterium]|nr:hypothetical protein [Nitrospirota bacterium]
MKSDQWLLEKIIGESINKNDVAHLRKLIGDGYSDKEILERLRERMRLNSKGMLAYIRHEKIRALTIKLSYRIHWSYIPQIIKEWLREKEILIRWKEHKHGDKIDRKARELKGELLNQGCRVKFNHMNEDDLQGLFVKLERAAEEILLHIEKEEGG